MITKQLHKILQKSKSCLIVHLTHWSWTVNTAVSSCTDTCYTMQYFGNMSSYKHTHPPGGTHRDQTKKTTGGKRERGKNSCRHNQMSHRSAVLLCTVCLSVIYLVFTVAALCMKTDRRVCIDRWKVCVIRIKTRQAEMLKVNRLRCASCVVDDSCHQRLLLHLTRFAQTREILCSPTPPRINSHGVVAALLFGFEEAHGEESACLQTQH